MSQGMITKAMMFVVIIIANMLDASLAEGLPVAKTVVITFYIGLEGLSILENLGQMNVPIPKVIKERLMVLKENGGDGK
jgi:toxin secretion/phage lysis holin